MKTKILLFVLFATIVYAQDDIQIGTQNETRPAATGALYDYSVQNAINIKVQLWGFVRFPGYYIVPAGTNIVELITLAGGPTEDALTDDIRLIKKERDYGTVMLKFNYNAFLWEDELDTKVQFQMLDAGDIVSVPGAPRYFVREDIAFYLGILTAIASLTALVLSVISITQ